SGAHADRMVESGGADGGHVVPSRAAAAGVDYRSAIHVIGGWRPRRRWGRRRTRRGRRRGRARRSHGAAGAARGASGTELRLPARLQDRNVDERHDVDPGRHGRRLRRDDDDHVQAGAGEVRAADADGGNAESAAAVDYATETVRSAEDEIGVPGFRGSGGRGSGGPTFGDSGTEPRTRTPEPRNLERRRE